MTERSPGPNADLAQLVAAAADLCRKPLRHAVLPAGEGENAMNGALDSDDCCLWLQVRSAIGERMPQEDLELEVYRSGSTLNLTVAWLQDEQRPMLWHGQHPVWMSAFSGERCSRPSDGAPLEALARRLRALLGEIQPENSTPSDKPMD